MISRRKRVNAGFPAIGHQSLITDYPSPITRTRCEHYVFAD